MLARLLLLFALLSPGLFAQENETGSDPVWIDVRTGSEYRAGHLEGAHNIPFDAIEKGVAELGLDRDAPIYLYCGSGGRAERARQTLLNLGFTSVTNAGGLEDARGLK